MNMVKLLLAAKEPRVPELGGKGYSLAVLINNGFNVPKGFVIMSLAFIHFLKYNGILGRIRKLAAEINEGDFQKKSKTARDLILSGEVPEDAVLEIKNNLDELNVQHVCIRSSAVSEDSLEASFAGVYDTFLNVRIRLDLVLEHLKKCWASLFSERAVIYRIRKKIPHLEGMAVIVQEMMPGEISGITFTVHPVDEKSLLVEASYGIGDMLVSGKVEPDGYKVDRETLEVVERKIGKKDKMSIVEGEGIKVVDVEKELAERQVLSDERIKEITKASLMVEKIFNYPQDIEWCISHNNLCLVQSRAITGGIR